MADRELADRELADRELADRELTCGELADRELTCGELAYRELTCGELAYRELTCRGGMDVGGFDWLPISDRESLLYFRHSRRVTRRIFQRRKPRGVPSY